MNISLPQLKEIVENAARGVNSVVEYNNSQYGLFWDNQASESIAISHPSSLYQADIYLWSILPEPLVRGVLFHEILEADLRFGQGLKHDDAHRIAGILEDAFARESFSELSLHRYRYQKKEITRINDAFYAFDEGKESKERYERLRKRFLKRYWNTRMREV